jgi:hypothetical protein
MDPVTIIVMALAMGAAAGLKPTAEQAVKDAYSGLKQILITRYKISQTSLAQLEENPQSKARQSVVQETLKHDQVVGDEELLQQAKSVMQEVQHHDPATAGVVGVELEGIHAASLTIDEILSTGVGVRVKSADIEGDIHISKVRAGKTKSKSPKG